MRFDNFLNEEFFLTSIKLKKKKKIRTRKIEIKKLKKTPANC